MNSIRYKEKILLQTVWLKNYLSLALDMKLDSPIFWTYSTNVFVYKNYSKQALHIRSKQDDRNSAI